MRPQAFGKMRLMSPGGGLHVPASAAVILFLSAASAQAADAAHGAQVFKACAPCHSIEAGQRSFMGPDLNGVVGCKAASDADRADVIAFLKTKGGK
ncbi:MAG TPA: hypothetical protein VJS38_01555 [Phenylobacterium sp.]|uniref:c-type cytochrome n=1 Tax=Phenylobacterium sp. TaxID=1871053 RepID=UPI002B4611D4|nr:hypothetical protein [Phenylobacterium sp.]HKR86837.1 hypothetical protein [Phenylobacterium sp.]